MKCTNGNAFFVGIVYIIIQMNTDENGYTLSSEDKTGGFKEIYLWLFVDVMY